jgi:hypothetical protein
MRGINISHNKLKNSGIIFEMLVRQITVDTLNGNSASPALDILKKYFNVNRELGKELQLYQSFFNTESLTESRALQFVDMIINQRRKLDEKKLAREKYDLIKEIKSQYDLKEFLSCKLPTYKTYASIYKTFMMETRTDDTTIINLHEVASAKFALLEHLIGNKKKPVNTEPEAISEFKDMPEDLRLITYKVLVEKFNDKYASLNGEQKALLREYINNVTSSNTLTNYVKQQIPAIQRKIAKHLASVDNKVTQIKLKEVALQLESMTAKKVIKDNDVTALMIAYEIARELEHASK